MYNISVEILRTALSAIYFVFYALKGLKTSLSNDHVKILDYLKRNLFNSGTAKSLAASTRRTAE